MEAKEICHYAYRPTLVSTEITLFDEKKLVGYFDYNTIENEAKNEWNFVINSDKNIMLLKGKDVKEINKNYGPSIQEIRMLLLRKKLKMEYA